MSSRPLLRCLPRAALGRPNLGYRKIGKQTTDAMRIYTYIPVPNDVAKTRYLIRESEEALVSLFSVVASTN